MTKTEKNINTKIERKKRTPFNIWRELDDLKTAFKNLPSDDECFKMLSLGRVSSIGFVKFVSEFCVINELYASTLRVGKSHLCVLDSLYRKGRLKNATFVVGSLMKKDGEVGKSYQYYENLEKVCENNNWKIKVLNNHSKILLFDTSLGKFVLETSSNLNENPNIEHFSFEKNDELWKCYRDCFEALTSE